MIKPLGSTGLMAAISPSMDSQSIAHGFFTRCGGVSKGIYEGLNCGYGSGDDAVNVSENRHMVAEALSNRRDTPVMTPYQVHGSRCLSVAGPFDADGEQADALVTNTPGLIIGVLTADCTPTLFYDAAAGVIGVAHAGWKGARAGIIEATLDQMVTFGADIDRIAVAIGPLLQQDSYEVTEEFWRLFEQDTCSAPRYFKRGKDKSHKQFDLNRYVIDRLETYGVKNIWSSGLDTYSDSSKFYSYRRSLHKQEPDYGRLFTGIMLKK